jgi:hypothetical protein
LRWKEYAGLHINVDQTLRIDTLHRHSARIPIATTLLSMTGTYHVWVLPAAEVRGAATTVTAQSVACSTPLMAGISSMENGILLAHRSETSIEAPQELDVEDCGKTSTNWRARRITVR